jgi:hypothetical protein
MKKLVYLVVVAASVSFLVSSCGGPKKMEEKSGAEEIVLPLSGKEYQSDKEYYRAKSSGKSPDISTAKKIALNNAKAEVAGLINSKIKAVTDNYTNQRSTADAQDFENKFETMTREVVNQQLVDVNIIGEKLFQKDKTYEYWIAIQVSKQAILEGISNSISKNQKLAIDYDKKKFEETYNAEMEKMDNPQ